MSEQITASQSGTHKAYHVEVRSGVKHPVMLYGHSYGETWTTFTPKQTCLTPGPLARIDALFDLLTYEAAMAIAWMVMAHSKSFAEKDAFGVQVRVVESQVEYSYKAVRTKEFPNIPWRGNGNEEP